MKTKTIHQSFTINVTPHELYETYLDPRKHAKITGTKAKFSREPGSPFTADGTHVTGILMEFVPDEKIVLSWHGANWPEGHFSKVTLRFEPARNGETWLILHQSGVPEELFDGTEKYWNERYWEPLKRKFAANARK